MTPEEAPQQFHPMNEPYISSQRYTGSQRRSSNQGQTSPSHESYNRNTGHSTGNNSGNNSIVLQAYESEKLLQYSQVSSGSENNQNKQAYSRSSTNILGSFERNMEYAGTGNNLSRHQFEPQQEYERHSNSHQNNSRITHQTTTQSYVINGFNGSNQCSRTQEADLSDHLSSNMLHEKIHYLEKQLQELTRLLHEESKHSYGSSSGREYEEVAIQNAQLTIKVQELQEEIQRVNHEKIRAEKEVVQLGIEYEKEHKINNELREKLMETNSKLTQFERQLSEAMRHQNQAESKPNSSKSLSQASQERHLVHIATLERENARLNEEIETLLSKLHNLNLEINEEQSLKDELMTKMNEQLEEIEKLRKELSDQEVEKLELQSMNEYLKQEINYVNELSAKRQKQLQEKYIKEEVERGFNQGNALGEEKRENQELKSKISQLQAHILELESNYKELEESYHTLSTSSHQIQSKNNDLQSHILKLQTHIHQLEYNIQSIQSHSNNMSEESEQTIESLKLRTRELETQVIQLTHTNESLSYEVNELKKKPITPPRETKSEPFKELFSIQESLRQEIRLLERELSEEKSRHQTISDKFNEMIEQRSTQVYDLEADIRKLESENRRLESEMRTLNYELQDVTKQRDDAKRECERLEEENNELKMSTKKTIQIGSSHNRRPIDAYGSSSKSIISMNGSGSWQQLSSEKRIERAKMQERIKHEETIRSNNELNKQMLEQKNMELYMYKNTVNSLEQELTQRKTQVYELTARLQGKERQLKEREYLLTELQELQMRHEQLLDEVKMIKSNKISSRTHLKDENEERIQDENLRKEFQQEIHKLDEVIRTKNIKINEVQQELRRLQGANFELAKEVNNLKEENHNLKLQNAQKQPSLKPEPFPNIASAVPGTSCPLCPQVLKEFNVYKQLMELKFETMNEMLDELKISFIRAQFQIRDQIHKDKSKYEHWIQKYDEHDKEYRTLMERLWEWEKINARNNITKEEGFATFGNLTFQNSNKELYIEKNGLKIFDAHKQQQSNTNKSKKLHSEQQSASPAHLSEIQYDLYLIKLENSTLRSQIATLQKQLSQRQINPQISKQLEQLKKYSENLSQQNQELKNHLNQVMMSQKRIGSQRELGSDGGNSDRLSGSSSRMVKKESIFERYSNIANINTELQEKTRNQEKALASAQLLINKLKKQNDNLIEAKQFLEIELQRESQKYRQLVKEVESQRQKTRRQHEMALTSNMAPNSRRNSLTNSNLELIDRNNIPFEYVKHHPEHKRLQTDYVSLKRSFLELDLEFKKAKEFYEEELQKIKIQNDFHKERIAKLQEEISSNFKTQLIAIGSGNENVQNGTIFSFNNNPSTNNPHLLNPKDIPVQTNQMRFSSEMSKIKQNAISMSLSQDTINFNETKIKALQERVLYLEKQVEIKCQQCQEYIKKYQELIKQLAYNPRTPRSMSNQENINRIQKLAHNIDVSPIQSPQWHTHSAQRQNSDRLFVDTPNNNSTSFDQKIIDKLKQCIDKKMIQLEITPRESSNIVIKATWFIERLANDIKELRNNIQILKGQRKAIMKERNELKSMIDNEDHQIGENYGLQVMERGFKKPIQHERQLEIYKNQHRSNEYNFSSEATGYEFHKTTKQTSTHNINTKPQVPHIQHQIHQKIPKLNFQANDSPNKSDQSNENQIPDIIKQTLELKNHRRSGLKKFQQQLQVLSQN